MKCANCGSELQTGDTGFICSKCKSKQINQPFYYGWICPRCGKVHSPYSTHCDCTPPVITGITNPLLT